MHHKLLVKKNNRNKKLRCIATYSRRLGRFKTSAILNRSTLIGAGRILKVEGHSGGSKYFGSAKKIFGAPHFSVVPTLFLMELGAQPSKLNNSSCHF